MKHRLDNGLKENPQNIQELYEHFLLAYDKVPRINEKPNDSLLLPISEQYKTNQKAGNEKTQNEKVIKYRLKAIQKEPCYVKHGP